MSVVKYSGGYLKKCGYFGILMKLSQHFDKLTLFCTHSTKMLICWYHFVGIHKKNVDMLILFCRHFQKNVDILKNVDMLTLFCGHSEKMLRCWYVDMLTLFFGPFQQKNDMLTLFCGPFQKMFICWHYFWAFWKNVDMLTLFCDLFKKCRYVDM